MRITYRPVVECLEDRLTCDGGFVLAMGCAPNPSPLLRPPVIAPPALNPPPVIPKGWAGPDQPAHLQPHHNPFPDVPDPAEVLQNPTLGPVFPSDPKNLPWILFPTEQRHNQNNINIIM